MGYQEQKALFRQRTTTLAQATAQNPVLLEGEKWWEVDAANLTTGRSKTGKDGRVANNVIVGTAFNDLPFDPVLGGGGGGASLSDATPQALGTATPGTALAASRGDHRHAMPTAAQVGADAAGTAAAAVAGAAGSYATAAQGALATTAVQPAALASGLAGKVDTSDSRLSDSREWSAATVDQATAEAGASTVRVAYNPLRVFQSIAAWWAASAFKAKLDGIAAGATANATDAQLRDRSTHTGTQALSTITGLGAGVPTALAINIGAAGAPVILGGAGGTPSALALPNATGLPLTTGVTGVLPVANGGTGTATPGLIAGAHVSISGTWPNQTITVTGGGHGGGGDALTTNPLSQFAATTSAQLRGVISDETGTGLLFFQGGDIGTPSAGVLANCTGLPVSTGVTGLGTGVAAALAVNTGSSGAPVLLNGAGGTPSGLVLTNATGLPFGTGISGKPTTLAGYGISDAVGSSDARLSDARTPTAHNQAWSTITATPTTLSGYGITDGFTEAQVRATPLAGYASGAGTVAETDSILQAIQKLAGNIANRALAGLIGSSGLTMATNRLAGRFDAGAGAVQEITPAGGLSLQSGNLVMTEGIALVCSETGETVAARLNHKEKAVDRACTVVRVTWELAPTSPSTSGSTQAMLYARRSGTKTSLLTGNASLPVTTGIFTDVSGTLTGTLTLAAGDTLGVDLNQVGTGASGLILTAYVRYS